LAVDIVVAAAYMAMQGAGGAVGGCICQGLGRPVRAACPAELAMSIAGLG